MKTREEILATLSIDEKIRLLNGVGNWNTYSADGKVPVISVSDGPHGLRHQVVADINDINNSNIATCFPTACAISSSWNVDAAKKMAQAIATEAKAENVQIVLGCGMNIKRSPLCGRNFEYFSEDPLLSGEMAAGFVNGMQSKNVGACLKHFALNNQEKYRQSSSSNADERSLREIYLAGFERTVRKTQPHSIMCSYNKINGVFSSANKKLLTEILRDDWGFKGIVMSDWGANIDAVNSLKAGLDLGMPDSNGYFEEQLKAAYEKGQLTEADIDKACKRIIDLALLYDAHKDEYAGGSKAEPVDFKVQHNIAYELACESAVLLKNDGIFPLPQKQKILVVGELAQNMRFQGGGSSHISTAPYPDALESLKKYYDVEYVPGYLSTFCKAGKKQKINEKLRAEAVKKISDFIEKNPRAPLLYFCGLEESYEGEGFDRDDLKLPASHIKLYNEIIKITKNIALVTFSGSAIDLSFAPEARAILHMYLCGEACGEACADLLAGIKNPSGKLAETWPCKIEVGAPVDDLDVDYKEGVLVGYRWYESKNIPVQYEFGFGLSYTKFEYSDLKVEPKEWSLSSSKGPVEVTFTIQNIGTVDGSEVAEVYVKNPIDDLEISRSAIELKGFEKVFLKAGEKKTLTITLDDRAFSVYSTKKKCFATVQGDYTICVGASVKDIKLSAPIKVQGYDIHELVRTDKEEQEGIFVKHPRHKKGEFTVTDSLIAMSKESLYVKILLKIYRLVIILSSKSKSTDDPAVKIGITGIEENPLESLISISGGRITKKFARRIVKQANR